MGYSLAGFDVVGIDVEPQPDYPFPFIQEDVMRLSTRLFEGYDLIHASPPCQRWAVGRQREDHPDLIVPTRELLLESGVPFVIENVPQAPIRRDLMLCGSMFGMEVQRHRHFEIHGFTVPQPECVHSWIAGRPHTVTGHADGPKGMFRKGQKYLGFRDRDHAQELMRMPWVKTTRGITEAIPPSYTEYIGKHYASE